MCDRGKKEGEEEQDPLYFSRAIKGQAVQLKYNKMDLFSLLMVGRQERSLAQGTYQCTCWLGSSDKRAVAEILKQIIYSFSTRRTRAIAGEFWYAGLGDVALSNGTM